MAFQVERDEVGAAARETFLDWWRGLGEAQRLLQRVSQEPVDGEWTSEFLVYDADGEYGWFGYAVERADGGWRCDQYYEGDSTMKQGCDWEPPGEGPAYAAERAASRNEPPPPEEFPGEVMEV